MDSGYSGSEKRRFERVNVGFFVVCIVKKPFDVIAQVGNREINAVMRDLTQAGMCILSSYDIPASTLLSIKFILIDTRAFKEGRVRSIQLSGEVRHSTLIQKNDHYLGIQFAHIDEEDKLALADFCRKNN
jgi:ABC-type lipopolysaccharide export system ATPase subunit